MIQVTEWCQNRQDIQFAFDQIEKNKPSVAVIRHTKKGFAVFRTDMFANGRQKEGK